MKEKPHIHKRALFVGCFVFFLCAAILSIFIFLLLKGKGEPANLITATRVTQEFLESIHVGDMQSAHSMLSEKFRPPVTVEQFAAFIQQDQNIFNTYRDWQICDWGVFIGDGYVIDTSGLLYYESKSIVVQISLHKDSDSIWRIQGFKFRTDISPTPYGLCQ